MQVPTDTLNNRGNRQDKKPRTSGQWDLEMNHSHFLMLDDGRQRTYDCEDYRTRIAVQLAKLREENSVFSKLIFYRFQLTIDRQHKEVHIDRCFTVVKIFVL